jgi:hypothetical protein
MTAPTACLQGPRLVSWERWRLAGSSLVLLSQPVRGGQTAWASALRELTWIRKESTLKQAHWGEKVTERVVRQPLARLGFGWECRLVLGRP